mgnify:FL=1
MLLHVFGYTLLSNATELEFFLVPSSPRVPMLEGETPEAWKDRLERLYVQKISHLNQSVMLSPFYSVAANLSTNALWHDLLEWCSIRVRQACIFLDADTGCYFAQGLALQ